MQRLSKGNRRVASSDLHVVLNSVKDCSGWSSDVALSRL